MALLRGAAKFDPFLSLDCAPMPSTLAQSKERKGSNFAILFAGSLVYIWAHGRSDDAFYAANELKYHGSWRGVGSIGA